MVGEKEHQQTSAKILKQKKEEVVQLLKENANQRQILSAIELTLNGKKKKPNTPAKNNNKTPASTRQQMMLIEAKTKNSKSATKRTRVPSYKTPPATTKENVAPVVAQSVEFNKTRPVQYDSKKYACPPKPMTTRRSVKPSDQTVVVETQIVRHIAHSIAGMNFLK